MAANFNFSIVDGVLVYKDATGNTLAIPDVNDITGTIEGFTVACIADEYKKKVYSANSLVYHGHGFYYNHNAINTAEDWNESHWTQTRLSDYITLMTN